MQSTMPESSRSDPAGLDEPGFESVARAMLPRPVVVHGGRIDKLQAPLADTEAGFVQNAVPRRVREFTAGRHCARTALARLGFPVDAIPMGPRREPLWPHGVIGSISHGAGYCLAAVCERSRFAGIGVDIESPSGLPATLVDLVCTPCEREWCERREPDAARLLAKFMFSAKESVFKCLYPVYAQELEFEDVTLDLDLEACRFLAHVPASALDADADLEVRGRFACTGEFVMTCAVLSEADFLRLRKPDARLPRFSPSPRLPIC